MGQLRALRRPARAAAAPAILAVLTSLGLLSLLPGAGLADPPAAQIRVEGIGATRFDPEPDPSQPVDACTFSVDVTGDSELATGTFDCELSDAAVALGLPFTSAREDASSLVHVTQTSATISGTATLQLPDGSELTGVEARVRVRSGGPDLGIVDIRLLGVFDGEPGDIEPGDGNYTLWQQVVDHGSIMVGAALPSPTPTVTGSPSPSPTESPSPTPTGSPSPSPTSTPTPSPSGSSTSPPPFPTGPPPTTSGPFTIRGSNSTARLMAILSQIAPDGMTPTQQDILAVVGPFPVAGLSWWQNDWHAYRCCPYPHFHEGLDMFAPAGTPLVAAADGVISQKVNGAISGLGIEITDANNTQYFYAHLSAFAVGIEQGQGVHVGQVIGYVGMTGDAQGTSPHLHLEIQPNGIPEPPMPTVDAWLALAESRAIALVEARTGGHVAPLVGLPDWVQRALLLAAQNQAQEGESAGAPSQVAPRLASNQRPPVATGAIMAFAAGAFLLLLVAPGCLLGLRQARSDPRVARASPTVTRGRFRRKRRQTRRGRRGPAQKPGIATG